MNYAPDLTPIFLIDPNPPANLPKWIQVIAKGASEGVAELIILLAELEKTHKIKKQR